MAVAAAREWVERSRSRPAAVRWAWVVLAVRPALGSSRNALMLPACRPRPGVGQLPRALQSLYGQERGGGLHRVPRLTSRRGRRAAGGRRRSGRREPCVTAETAALGGGESLWPGADASSVLRSEIVLPLLSGNSDRGFGLMLGAGDGRLGPGTQWVSVGGSCRTFEGAEHVFLMGSWWPQR